MNIKNITLAILLCLGFGSAMAQETYTSTGRPVDAPKKQYKKKGFDASRIIWGGGMGLSFGSVTDVSVSPVVGYRFSDKFSAGVGFGFEYLRIKNAYEFQDPYDPYGTVVKPYSATVYSPSVWTRYIFYKNLFAHMEYEHNFLTGKGFDNLGAPTNNSTFSIESFTERVNVPCLLLGVGLRQPISDRVSLLLLGMYDILQNQHSPYKNTLVIRFGVAVNF